MKKKYGDLTTRMRYEVSSYGRIRSIRFLQYTNRYTVEYLMDLPSEKIPNKEEYFEVTLCAQFQKTIVVHKIVARTFKGQRPIDKVIDHNDRKRQNNHYLNLEYVSVSDNNFNRSSYTQNYKFIPPTKKEIIEMGPPKQHPVFRVMVHYRVVLYII